MTPRGRIATRGWIGQAAIPCERSPLYRPSVTICIPVRNEAEALPSLLTALAGQHVGDLDLACCFFLDGCDDQSEAMLRTSAGRFPHDLRIAVGARGADCNAGRARRAAMAMGIDRRAEEPDAILLTTDADSVPAADWVVMACDALDTADVAVGTLLLSEPHPLQTRVAAYYDGLHRYRRTVDPVPWDGVGGRHSAGGANLAIRAGVYVALGGFAPIPSGEDAMLLDDASRAGFRVRRDPAMIVETSSRRDGRAAGGLAAALADLDRDGLPPVPHPAGAAWQYRAQARARAAFAHLGDQAACRQLGAQLGLTGDHVLGVARDCPNAEAFAMRVVPSPAATEPPIPFVDAERALAALERALSEEAA